MKNNKIEKYTLSYIDRNWKEKNNKYLKELQIFFDIVEQIKDTELRRKILNQMLICDNVLTEIAEENFRKLLKE